MSWNCWMIVLALGLLVGTIVPVEAEEKPLTYPPTRRVNHVDLYHGIEVRDPYRWLEKDVRESKDVADWVAEENKVTNAYLNTIPERDAIRKRLTGLWNYEKFSAPFKVGGRYFYSRNDGLQNQSVLWTMDRLDGEPRILLDPNTLSADGTVALSGLSVSDDGKYLAYGVAASGSDWQTWHVLDIATGKLLADELKWIKFSDATWTKDGRGFFYSRYEEPKKDQQFQGLNKNQKLCYHRIGTPQDDDVIVYKRPDQPEWGFSAQVSDDGRYLVISTWKGTDHRNRVTYKDLQEPYGLPIDLIDNLDHEYSFIDNDGPIFFFKTDQDAPRGRVIAIDIRKPQLKNWKEIIPQAAETLRGVHLVGNLFVTSYLKDARTQVKLFTLEGKFLREVEFPGIGTAAGFTGGKRTDTETFYSFSSFATPPSIYRYDLITGESKRLRQAKVKFDPDRYEVKQVFYKSKDGTQSPHVHHGEEGHCPGRLASDAAVRLRRLQHPADAGVLGHPADVAGDGRRLRPGQPPRRRRVRRGVAQGGHQAEEAERLRRFHRRRGVPDRQQVHPHAETGHRGPQQRRSAGRSVHDAAAGPVRGLPAGGGRDGHAPLPQFTAGRYWVDDYGSSDNPEEFKALRAYSPYHNLKKGTHYPPTLVTTADTDDRVVPLHSFKFIAELQHCQGSPAPVLARIETKAGHGAGKPTSKQIEEVADELAFLVKNLKMKLP